MVPFELGNNEKFALIALDHCYHDVKDETELSDGTWVLPKMPVPMDEWWVQQIGKIRAEQLTRANLVLIRRVVSAEPDILDGELTAIQDYLAELFAMLQLTRIVSYDYGHSILGSRTRNRITIRQMGQLEKLYVGLKAPQYPVTRARLDEAVEIADAWRGLVKAGTHARVIRGAVVLRDGFLSFHGQERIQFFMRALEAVLLPRERKTAPDIKHRGQSLGIRSKAAEKMLYEAYQMRCDSEHMHAADRKLREEYPTATDAELEDIATLRVRQMEALARESYRRILTNDAIRDHFATDASIEAYWALQEHERSAIWGKGIDVTGFKPDDEYEEKKRQVLGRHG
jgi:hypothetical protein